MDEREIEVAVFRGPQGSTLYVDDTRVAGPKAHLGASAVARWTVSIDEFRRVLDESERVLKVPHG